MFLALAVVAAYRGLGARDSAAAIGRSTPEARLQALDETLRRHPYLEEARRQRALAWTQLAYSKGGYDRARLDRAEADFALLVRLRPHWGLVWADRGWNAFFRGDVSAARDHFARATALDPTHVGIGTSRAQFLVWSGSLIDAVEEVRRLRLSEPSWSREAARGLVASWTNDSALLATIP
jgi:Flp pilus assembly protein TadD